MNADEIIKALRWIARNDEICFNAEQANIAADLLEQQQTEIKQMKASQPVRCGECVYLQEHHYEEEGEKPYIKYGCKYRGHYQVHLKDSCSYGERRAEEWARLKEL